MRDKALTVSAGQRAHRGMDSVEWRVVFVSPVCPQGVHSVSRLYSCGGVACASVLSSACVVGGRGRRAEVVAWLSCGLWLCACRGAERGPGHAGSSPGCWQLPTAASCRGAETREPTLWRAADCRTRRTCRMRHVILASASVSKRLEIVPLLTDVCDVSARDCNAVGALQRDVGLGYASTP